MGLIVPPLLQVIGRGQTSYSWKFNYIPPGSALYARRMIVSLNFRPAAAVVSTLKIGLTSATLLYTVALPSSTLLVYNLNALAQVITADPGTVTLTFDQTTDVYLRIHVVLDDVPSRDLLLTQAVV